MRGSAYTAVVSDGEESSPPSPKGKMMRQLSPTLWDHRKKQLTMMKPAKKSRGHRVQLRPLDASANPIKNEFLNAAADGPADDISRLTDDFRTLRQEDTLREVEAALEAAIALEEDDDKYPPEPSLLQPSEIGLVSTSGSSSSHPRRRRLMVRERGNDYLTFRRRVGRLLRETSVKADRMDETMKDMVTRLQRDDHGGDKVLRFSKDQAKAIMEGTKLIRFSIAQLPNVKFSKEEFGELTAAQVLELTSDRPVVLEILVEDSVEGEDLVIF